MRAAGIFLFAFFAVASLSADTFRFTGDRMSTSLAAGKERTLLRGNARIKSDQTEITADEIEIFGKDFQFAECRGNVVARDSEKNLYITCETLRFDRTSKNILAVGSAYMEDEENEIIIRAHRLENRDKEDLVVIQTGGRIIKKDLAARAEFASYRRDTNTLELSGMPVLFWKKDEYRATRIVMNLDTEEITLLGAVTGTIVSENESEAEKEEEEPAGE
ncbi:MAG: organic solvent tolerance protein OstA [Spirochaetaceae bacterium]|nr:organic solvent tolerance protein OstA [Spirochaetaceae bacterium]